MRTASAFATAMAFLLIAALPAQAHMTGESSNFPTEPLVPGQEYTVDYRGSYLCPEALASLSEGDTLTFSIFNQDEFSWLNASEHDHTVSYTACANEGDPGHLIFPGTVTFTADARAPAFQDFVLKTGAYGQNNEGSDFTVQIAYDPAFTAPNALSFDATGGGATATIPLTMSANADSVFNFDVTSFTVDGADAPEGSTAHIQETLELATGIFSDEGTASTTVDLHFGVGDGGHMDHDMDAMADDDLAEEDHADHGDEGADTGVTWESAQVILSITLAAKEDPTQVSEPRLVTLTFDNADAEAMPHDDDHDHETDGDESNFLPGFEAVAAVAVLGAVAALRRRS